MTTPATGEHFRRPLCASLTCDASLPCARAGEEPVRAPGGPAGPVRAMAGEPRAAGGYRAGRPDPAGRGARQRGRGFGDGAGGGDRARASSVPGVPSLGQGLSPCPFPEPGLGRPPFPKLGLMAPSVPGTGEAAAGGADPGARAWQPQWVPP